MKSVPKWDNRYAMHLNNNDDYDNKEDNKDKPLTEYVILRKTALHFSCFFFSSYSEKCIDMKQKPYKFKRQILQQQI